MKQFKSTELPLSKLLLDNDNPRHDPIDNESEIIATLLRRERVLPLSRDIAARKAMSPFDRIGVIPHPRLPGKYVVAEGNRRVCALRLLSDPDKAPDAKIRAIFEVLAKEVGKLPAKVEVVVLKDEEEAREWKALRHEGEQGGVGLRKWNAAGKARHAAKGGSSNPNALALALLDYAEGAGLIEGDDRESLAITTLTRYLSNPVVRHTLGIASNRELTIDVAQDEFDRVAVAFLNDAIGADAKVHSRSSKDDRKAYAAGLRTRGLAPVNRLSAPVAPSINAASKKRHNRSPQDRPRVVPSDFKAHCHGVLKRVFDELRQIDPTFSFAAGYLFRAFLDQLVRDYARNHQLSADGEMHKVVDRCVKHLEAEPDLIAQLGRVPLSNRLKAWRVMVNDRDSRLSPETLGAWVHGSSIPTGAEIKARWDTLEPGIRLLLDRLKP